MLDQAFHATKAFGEREEAAVFQEAFGSREVRFQHDRHHPAKRAHLASRKVMLRMRGQPRVVNVRDFHLLGEPVRQVSGSSASDSVQRFIGA